MKKSVRFWIAVVPLLTSLAVWGQGRQCQSIALDGDYSYTAESWNGTAQPLAPAFVVGSVTFNRTAGSITGRGMTTSLGVSSTDSVTGTFALDGSCTVALQLTISANGSTSVLHLYGMAVVSGVTSETAPVSEQCGPRVVKIQAIVIASPFTPMTRRFTFERIDQTTCSLPSPAASSGVIYR